MLLLSTHLSRENSKEPEISPGQHKRGEMNGDSGHRNKRIYAGKYRIC